MMSNIKKRKIHPIFRTALIVFAVFTLFRIGSLHFQIIELRKESRDLDEQIAKQTEINEDVHNSYMNGSEDQALTDEAIAKIARDVLGYASPGERIFIDSSEQ